MQAVDVVVVGAGPAGSAAATVLARGGRHVVVIDKATFPRDKCCGDGLTTGALRLLDRLGFDPATVPSWQEVDACWVRSPSGRTVEFAFPTGTGTFGAVARRTELDAALVDVARAAGATVIEGAGLERLAWNGAGVTVHALGHPAIDTRYVIGADGMWSPVRRALGLDVAGYLGEWHAFRQYIDAPGEGSRRLWVWFEPDLLPGYAWSFPLAGGVANVGFGIRRSAGEPTRSMAATWRRLLEVPHIAEALGDGAAPAGPLRAWPIPARLPSAALHGAGGRVLLAGDAACASDPLTGEGIAQALETGEAAARAIIHAGPARADEAARRYADAIGTGMVWDHRLAALLSHALTSSKGARGAVRIAGASAWTRRNFARWLFEDYPRAMLATPARWHSRMFTGPGAFQPAGAGATP